MVTDRQVPPVGQQLTSTTSASRAPAGRLSRTRSRSTFAASTQSPTKPIAETTAMYALSLPTIAQVFSQPGFAASTRYGEHVDRRLVVRVMLVVSVAGPVSRRGEREWAGWR